MSNPKHTALALFAALDEQKWDEAAMHFASLLPVHQHANLANFLQYAFHAGRSHAMTEFIELIQTLRDRRTPQ